MAVTQAPSATRRSILSTEHYAAAVRAVDWLSDEGFPVERVAIVGTGLGRSSRSPAA
jgi:heat induced stress protein YflT